MTEVQSGSPAADAGLMLQQLDSLLRPMFWRDVGPLREVPAGSRVLQSRHGYADVLRHDTRLRCLARVSALRELWRDLLAVKQVSRLYEVWCFFSVVEVLQTWLGEPVRAEVLRVDEFATALPEAVELLRAARRLDAAAEQGEEVELATCDPLNLVGIITAGPRVPAVRGHVLRYRDGEVVGAQMAG